MTSPSIERERRKRGKEKEVEKRERKPFFSHFDINHENIAVCPRLSSQHVTETSLSNQFLSQ